MSNEIKQCFQLFATYIKMNNIKTLDSYNTDTMTIPEIKATLNVIYMKYILASFSISPSSNIVFAYVHLIKMIDEYLSHNVQIPNTENDDVKMMDQDPNAPLVTDPPKKGWFSRA